jgi:hypothetical protein
VLVRLRLGQEVVSAPVVALAVAPVGRSVSLLALRAVIASGRLWDTVRVRF